LVEGERGFMRKRCRGAKEHDGAAEHRPVDEVNSTKARRGIGVLVRWDDRIDLAVGPNASACRNRNCAPPIDPAAGLGKLSR
jgi:hypothetical protein